MKSYLQFLRFLHSMDIQLTPAQKRLAAILISHARKEKQIRVLLTARGTGKTYVFDRVHEYFNQS